MGLGFQPWEFEYNYNINIKDIINISDISKLIKSKSELFEMVRSCYMRSGDSEAVTVVMGKMLKDREGGKDLRRDGWAELRIT